MNYNMDDGRWTMDDGRWTMDDGRWTMDDGRWTIEDGNAKAQRTQRTRKVNYCFATCRGTVRGALV
ncbi:MAG TPA: hypothetical protein VF826_08890 [Chloroflexia bacterium]